MHELTVTSLIVDSLLDLAKKQNASQVLEVNLKVGKLRALSLDQLSFCYEVLCKGNVLEGSNLIIEESPGKLRCVSCDYQSDFNPVGDAYHFGLPPMSCPACSGSLSVEGGDDCVITKVRMRIPSSPEKSVASV